MSHEKVKWRVKSEDAQAVFIEVQSKITDIMGTLSSLGNISGSDVILPFANGFGDNPMFKSCYIGIEKVGKFTYLVLNKGCLPAQLPGDHYYHTWDHYFTEFTFAISVVIESRHVPVMQ